MLRVREMTEADIEAVAAIRVRGWQFAYAGLMPQAYLDAMTVEEDAERRREHFARGRLAADNLVAERGGSVVGWSCTGPCRDEDAEPGDGELYALYVRPDQVATGVGRALLTESVRRATARGHAHLRLWVLQGNTRARRFYESAGFTPDGAEEPYEVDGVPVPELRYALPLPLPLPQGTHRQ
ncbi:GNAT family N-acetyltransferase [Streptomyces pathocidini]|uniref:GNAT family N-acetyltransferase n=1 Tax=Streptomyces pathocidini TaxID=1650571 RepID=A0ABW7UJU7_9ACTN|nr:GNAT family N-acetyltransferase [Streptomyces pathocidini]